MPNVLGSKSVKVKNKTEENNCAVFEVWYLQLGQMGREGFKRRQYFSKSLKEVAEGITGRSPSDSI